MPDLKSHISIFTDSVCVIKIRIDQNFFSETRESASHCEQLIIQRFDIPSSQKRLGILNVLTFFAASEP